MASTGTTTLDFNTGHPDAQTVVTGQGSILSNSRVSAWIEATATASHSVDEHRVEEIQVVCGAIVPGTGFTIYGQSISNDVLYGTYTVGWAWT